jgi:hypothetical protein
MIPVSPVVPGVNLPEVMVAKHQPEYLTLPSLEVGPGVKLTRWEMSPEEADQLRRTAQVDLFQWTGGARSHATQMLLDPVLDVRLWEMAPPVRAGVEAAPGCCLSIHWLESAADVEKAVAQGYVYLLIWHGADLIQPMIFEVDLNRVAAAKEVKADEQEKTLRQ